MAALIKAPRVFAIKNVNSWRSELKLLRALALVCAALGAAQDSLAGSPNESPAGVQAASAPVDTLQAKRLELRALERKIEQRGGGRVRYVDGLENEEPFRSYFDRFAKRVEEHGTAAFPVRAGQHVYGRALINVSIAPDGRILDLQVVKSDNPLITKSALAVLRAPGVCEPFGKEMSSRLDRIVLGAHFNYQQDSSARDSASR